MAYASLQPPPMSDARLDSVDSSQFYSEYHGHPIHSLDQVLSALRGAGGQSGAGPQAERSVLFFAGDSSLDNKFWFNDSAPAVNGYEAVLSPPRMKKDVCFWVNEELQRRGKGDAWACINAAVEESSLNSRACCNLLPQDRFVRSHIQKKDCLCVSVGGNDIALQPLICTIVNLCGLVYCCPLKAAKCAFGCAPDTGACLPDLGCFGCGVVPCVTSAFSAFPPFVGYFIDLFKNRVANYIERMLPSRHEDRPRKVLVCMIYFLDEKETGGWADPALGFMQYNTRPERVQTAIRTLFKLATQKITIKGVEQVIGVPLFKVLDGKDTADYVARVEPSSQGGEKMAKRIVDTLLGDLRWIEEEEKANRRDS